MSKQQNKSATPPIIDYEGSKYRTDFWEGKGRDYEDATERYAIKELLPTPGGILMEAGAGFGRLARLYDSYQKILLVDYSLSLLQEAQQIWGEDKRIMFVAASVYDLPFIDGLIDSIVMVRVMHHLHQPSLALSELARVLQGEGTFIVEYANKRNLKAMIRYWSRQQDWSPFEYQPYEFVHLNYDFHPTWMTENLLQSGFLIDKELAISNFRIEAVKRRFSASTLTQLDAMLAPLSSKLKLSPSVMVRCKKKSKTNNMSGFFKCTSCGDTNLVETDEIISCHECGNRWRIVDGVYDFRSTL